MCFTPSYKSKDDIFGPFLGSVVKNAKQKKVMPCIYLNLCNQKCVFKKCTYFGPKRIYCSRSILSQKNVHISKSYSKDPKSDVQIFGLITQRIFNPNVMVPEMFYLISEFVSKPVKNIQVWEISDEGFFIKQLKYVLYTLK